MLMYLVDNYGIRTWTGTSHVRSYMVADDTLTLETKPRTAGTDSRQFINTLTWERVEAFPLVMP